MAAFAQSEAKTHSNPISVDYLEVFKKYPTDFMRPFVTMDETWIHHLTSPFDLIKRR